MADQETGDRALAEVTEAVRALAELMRANGLTKIDVEVGELSIKLSAGTVREVVVAPPSPTEIPAVPVTAVVEAPVGHLITAPMIGTFYLSAGPGEPPFVRLGERVDAGQTIGIIEAMKIMNEIPADRAGVVAEILVTNAQAVEYGSPLIRIVSDGVAG